MPLSFIITFWYPIAMVVLSKIILAVYNKYSRLNKKNGRTTIWVFSWMFWCGGPARILLFLSQCNTPSTMAWAKISKLLNTQLFIVTEIECSVICKFAHRIYEQSYTKIAFKNIFFECSFLTTFLKIHMYAHLKL